MYDGHNRPNDAMQQYNVAPDAYTLLSSPVRNNALDMKKNGICRGFRKITTYLLYTVSLTFCSVKVINYGKKSPGMLL